MLKAVLTEYVDRKSKRGSLLLRQGNRGRVWRRFGRPPSAVDSYEGRVSEGAAACPPAVARNAQVGLPGAGRWIRGVACLAEALV